MKTLKTVRVFDVIIRLARNDYLEISQIAQLEREVWGDNGADTDKIISRLAIFPDGNYIAEDTKTGKITGYVCFQLTGDLRLQDNSSWSTITDKGFIAKSHQPEGEYLYGVNLSVHYSMNGKKLGAALVSQCFLYMIAERKTGIFTGSRIPMFKNYKARHPEISVEDYIELRRNRKFYDYELNLYHQTGLAPVNAKVLPDFFPDDDSLNYGVLIFDINPFKDSPEPKITRIVKMLIDQDLIGLKKEVDI